MDIALFQLVFLWICTGYPHLSTTLIFVTETSYFRLDMAESGELWMKVEYVTYKSYPQVIHRCLHQCSLSTSTMHNGTLDAFLGTGVTDSEEVLLAGGDGEDNLLKHCSISCV